MTKADLIEALENQGKLTFKQAEMIVNITIESIIRTLYNDDRVEFRGFGVFDSRCYKRYTARNPKTHQVIDVAPKKRPFFRPGKDLLKRINEERTKYPIKNDK